MSIVGADNIAWIHIVDRKLLVGRNRSAQRFTYQAEDASPARPISRP